MKLDPLSKSKTTKTNLKLMKITKNTQNNSTKKKKKTNVSCTHNPLQFCNLKKNGIPRQAYFKKQIMQMF
jgi:hypothetical protein